MTRPTGTAAPTVSATAATRMSTVSLALVSLLASSSALLRCQGFHVQPRLSPRLVPDSCFGERRTNDSPFDPFHPAAGAATVRTVLSVSSETTTPQSQPSSAASAETAPGTDAVKVPSKGSVVTIDCQLIPDGDFVPEPLFDGIVRDREQPKERLVFVLGGGNYLPGLHDVVFRMSSSSSQKRDIPLDAGWGAWNPDLQAELSFQALGSAIDRSQIRVGVELVLANGVRALVTDVNDDSFTIDANPPLAGASYRANIDLVEVNDGPTDFVYAPNANAESKYQLATFALGCFWGGELAFMREPGVVGTKVGYTQGHIEQPTYQDVCQGTTGHTEALMVTYDPSVVTYERLVHLAMDKLGEHKYMLNQVGNDKGTQYRHGVYYHNDEQKAVAESVVGTYGEDCVTEVLPASAFFDAEDYHQQYLLKGGQSARKGDTSTIRCYG